MYVRSYVHTMFSRRTCCCHNDMSLTVLSLRGSVVMWFCRHVVLSLRDYVVTWFRHYVVVSSRGSVVTWFCRHVVLSSRVSVAPATGGCRAGGNAVCEHRCVDDDDGSYSCHCLPGFEAAQPYGRCAGQSNTNPGCSNIPIIVYI